MADTSASWFPPAGWRGAAKPLRQPAAAPPLSGTLRPGLPILLYGLRLWAAVCLALFVAFYLQLDNPSWAGTSAAIVCQPVLGASLRKGWFRLIGTLIGAVAAVVLAGMFPQSRAGFLLGLAIWGGLCALVATLLTNYAQYAAALAGFTAAIISGDGLGAVGGGNVDAFTLAIARSTEIWVGIACASVVLAVTDLGGARRRLAELLVEHCIAVCNGLLGAFRLFGSAQVASRDHRRELLRRVTALGVVIDQAAGEISALPFRPRALQAAVEGLYNAIVVWRIIATHLERPPDDEGMAEAETVLGCVPQELMLPSGVGADRWRTDPAALHDLCRATAERLATLPATTPSLRLLADRAAEGLIGISRGLAGVMLLHRPRGRPAGPRARLRVPDVLPALINGVRAFLTIGAAELIWIATGWPSGAVFIMFTSVAIILFAPREDIAYRLTLDFMVGTIITAVFAAVVAFAVLPLVPTFAGFCVVIGVVLVPAGALSAQSWRQALFVAMAANFIPLLSPTNPMTYDPLAFYNTASGLLAGVALAMIGLRLLPPLPPEFRARRLLALTLRDLRRRARRPWFGSITEWEGHIYGRLSVLPDQSQPLDRSRLAAAVSVGAEIIRLRRIAARFNVGEPLEAALRAIAAGDSAGAILSLQRFDAALAEVPADAPAPRLRLRARGTIRAIAEALVDHATYFDAEVSA